MEKYYCKKCAKVFESNSSNAVCPYCNGNNNIPVRKKNNPYEGTLTEKNLRQAFLNESAARNKYTYFASVAKKEGYEQMAEIFLKTAENEKEHAKIWFKELNELNDTPKNLEVAALDEYHEWTGMYDLYAKIATEEGFLDLAQKFRMIASIEKSHEKQYLSLLKNIENDEVFKKSSVKIWVCRNCGYLVIGVSAPDTCPACDHPQSYYEVYNENL